MFSQEFGNNSAGESFGQGPDEKPCVNCCLPTSLQVVVTKTLSEDHPLVFH